MLRNILKEKVIAEVRKQNEQDEEALSMIKTIVDNTIKNLAEREMKINIESHKDDIIAFFEFILRPPGILVSNELYSEDFIKTLQASLGDELRRLGVIGGGGWHDERIRVYNTRNGFRVIFAVMFKKDEL